MLRGQDGPKGHRRREIETAAELTFVGSRSNYDEDVARIGAIGLRVKPGLGAELWRALAGAVARQGDVAAMA